MTTSPITIGGTLQSDGVTLQLEQRVALPPGRVTVTVQLASPGSGPSLLEVLDHIHRSQQQRGHKPMSEEEMAQEIAQMRAEENEYEKRCQKIWTQTGTATPGTDGS